MAKRCRDCADYGTDNCDCFREDIKIEPEITEMARKKNIEQYGYDCFVYKKEVV